MKKRILALMLTGAMALSLTACGGDSGSSSGAASSAGSSAGTGLKFALCMSHQTNEFTTLVGQGAKAKGEELGIQVDIFDGKQDSATQMSQVESAIQNGYDGIIIEPISTDGIVPAVKQANEADIPVITVVQAMSNQDTMAIAYCGGNEIQASETQMEKALELIGNAGNIAVIYGPMGSDAQLTRKQGYDNILANNPDVQIVFEETANWVTEEALTLVENWLSTGTKIDMIVSQNDSMAMGAVKAVEDAGLDIPVVGLDAVSDAVQAVADGRLEGTVSQDAFGQGALGVETMYKHLQGESIETTNYTECVWINADNVADYQ